ncbi:MAG TPA: amino acid adenylation domain-containing protein, partial [Candidatus Kapabacteria bacterium]|nr:amino acid adenylation domain-containing protein [Candidatus Kapabacteria bacterium]
MEKLDPNRIENIIALTSLQEGMLFHYLQVPQSQLYFEQLSLEISGEIDVPHFEKAWQVIIETNEMLRTVFRWEKVENPVQIVLKEHKFQPRYIHIAGQDAGERKERLEKIKRKDEQEKFDLQEVPFRVTLGKIEVDKYVMIISNHHILYDGWSTGIILKEFFKIYHELSRSGQALEFPVKLSFKEFVKWTQKQDKSKQENFWRNYLAGFEAPAELPIKRCIEKTTNAADYSIILAGNLKNKLDAFIRSNRVTLASVFYTAWGLLLQKYCGSEDVVFGTTVSGRSGGIKGIEDMVGLFINTVPLRIQTTSREKISEVVFQTDHILREREEFENTPLVDISSYSLMGRSESLFDTIIAIENYPLDNRLVPESSLLFIESYTMVEMAHYDLSIGIMPFNEIEIKFSFKPGLIAKETIENLAEHFKIIIQTIIENPETVLSQLEIITIDEKNQLLYEFNNTTAEYPKDKTIHQLFEEQVEKSSDRIALVGAGCVCPVSLTYRELNNQSGRLAGLLIEKGVLADTIIGIMIERSIEMLIGIMGILKAGGAYLPIDSGYPRERIDYMLKDSATRVLINKSEIRNSKFETNPNDQKINDQNKNQHFGAALVLNFENLDFEFVCTRNFEFRASDFNSSNLAYLIYTSGSTGKPKGIMIENRSVINFIKGITDIIPFQESDRILSLTTISFDIFGLETILPLIKGSVVIIGSAEAQRDVDLGARIMEREAITIFQATPSRLQLFIQGNQRALKGLKYLLVGGEVLPGPLLEILTPLTDGSIYNVYGPTETTIWSTIKEVSRGNTLNIGKPLANTFIYILSRGGLLQPVNVPGECFIGGDGVARGYLNKPELTAERFNRSYGSYKTYIFYKTGDLARWLPDGNLEFLGRIDNQVKIRGFRIELGEIEAQLLKHKHVNAAVVAAGEGDIPHLNAYIVLKNEEPETGAAEFKKYLSQQLPDYMIPSHFFLLEKIPLT